MPPHGGLPQSLGQHRRLLQSGPISCLRAGPVTFAAEDSPSGLWRSLGKRVGLTPSGVQIPYPPPPKRPVTCMNAVTGRFVVRLRDELRSATGPSPPPVITRPDPAHRSRGGSH